MNTGPQVLAVVHNKAVDSLYWFVLVVFSRQAWNLSFLFTAGMLTSFCFCYLCIHENICNENTSFADLIAGSLLSL